MIFDDFGQGLASGSSIFALKTFFVSRFSSNLTLQGFGKILVFSFCFFSDFVIFLKILILINFVPKVAANLSGSNKNLLSGAIKYSNWYYFCSN